jgi:arsenate reductase
MAKGARQAMTDEPSRSRMQTVLFVCEGNIFRSQMAEGFFNALAPQGWRAESAGTNPGSRLHPAAIALMSEIGIDISHQRPKAFDREIAARARRVIAMCNLGDCQPEVVAQTQRWPIIDPAALPEERWHEIRDEIGNRVKTLLEVVRRFSS